MLKFLAFDDGKPAKNWPLRNCYLIGADGSAMRGDIAFRNGTITCEKREGGAAALALLHPIGDCGEITLQTCLLPDRDEPYILNLELARHRLMVLYHKLEDWAMFELPADHAVIRRLEVGRKLFIEALCLQSDNPARCDELAHDCLCAAVDGSEELAVAHADLLVQRRRQTAALPRHPFGVGVALDEVHERLRPGIAGSFDFLCLPTPWKALTPAESEYRWPTCDGWVEWASKSRLPVVAGPVISFEPQQVPDWLYIWEHDYDTVRDLMYEHVERLVSRYRNVINAWNIVSGLHVNSHFAFSFDQLMDLTRMTTMLVKKIQPAAKVIIEVRQPFGEYYASNTRSIPPLMYADLIVQNAIQFDAVGVRLLLGQAQPGQFARDLMQVSNLLDQYGAYGKPIYVTMSAPSEPVTDVMIASPDGQAPADAHAGFWRRPWAPVVQSKWAEAALQVALSKPFVEAVAWSDLVDHPQMDLPLAGLISEDLQPKPAFRKFVGFRRVLLNLPSTSGSAVAAATTAGPVTPPLPA